MIPTKFRFIWPSGHREEDFKKNQPIRNKNCMWWPCLLTNRDEMNNLYRGHSINAPYQVSDQLVLRFQRRKVNRRRTTSDGKSSYCLRFWSYSKKNFPEGKYSIKHIIYKHNQQRWNLLFVKLFSSLTWN